MNYENEIKVQLKRFSKTPLELELESIYGIVFSDEQQIFTDIENTFYECMFEECTTNITIVTSLVSPQTYKFATFQVKIED